MVQRDIGGYSCPYCGEFTDDPFHKNACPALAQQAREKLAKQRKAEKAKLKKSIKTMLKGMRYSQLKNIAKQYGVKLIPKAESEDEFDRAIILMTQGLLEERDRDGGLPEWIKDLSKGVREFRDTKEAERNRARDIETINNHLDEIEESIRTA